MNGKYRRAFVTFLAIILVVVGALSALAADDITTGQPTDGSTDGTSVPSVEKIGEPTVEGEIRTSSISFERSVAETAVIYYFVYTGLGSVDFDYDGPSGCLVSFTGVTSSVIKHCAF